MMNFSKQYKQDKAVFVDEENLKDFDTFIKKYFFHVNYRCECSDNSVLECTELDEVFAYENPNFRKLRMIEIKADNRENAPDVTIVLYPSDFEIVFGDRWMFQSLQYSLKAKNFSNIDQFEFELKERIKEFVPWYWFISKANTYLLASLTSLLMLAVRGFFEVKADLDGKKFHSNEVNLSAPALVFVSIVTISIVFPLCYALDRLKNYLFLKVVISLGKQKTHTRRRKNILYFIFGMIILGIIINLFSSWLYNFLEK